MSNFSKGKHAQFISDRSGMAFPYKEMVREWNGSRVHVSEFEPKQPQLEPRAHGADPEGLQNAKPARTEFPTADFLPTNPFNSSKCWRWTLELYIVFLIPIVEYKLDDFVRFNVS
jgi:hypothetical protein